MKKILLLIVLLIVAAIAFMGISILMRDEAPSIPQKTTTTEAPDTGPVWTGGGKEPINAGLQLDEPPLEVLVHDGTYTNLNTDRANAAFRVTVNNLGPTGLGAWFNRPGAFTLYSASGGTVKSTLVRAGKTVGSQTQLTVFFRQVPTQPLNANQVALAIKVSADPTTNVAFGLTPPTADSLDAQKADPPAEPAAPETAAPATSAKNTSAKKAAPKKTAAKK